MQGFFSKEQVYKPYKNTKYSCASCGLSKKNNPIEPFGGFKKGIMNIGEVPSIKDTKLNKPFQGTTGKLLYKTYKKYGIDLFEDCINLFAVKCYNNKSTATNNQIECCRKHVIQAIEKYKPKIIITHGKSALYSIIGHRFKKDFGKIDKWRGWTIPDQDFKSWVCPLFNPTFLLDADKQYYTIWEKDIQNIFNIQGKPLQNREPNIIMLDDLSELNNIKAKQIAFDYETTGIKPHAPGHKIVSASVAIDTRTVYSFLMPQNRKDRQPFVNLLKNPDIEKIAFNMKFEAMWTKNILRTNIVNLAFDPMISTHILDNREGICSLKFQTYVKLGVIDYDSEIEPYLTSNNKKNKNSFNKIEELLKTPGGKNLLLKYNGLDSIYTFQLFEEHESLINFDNLPF